MDAVEKGKALAYAWQVLGSDANSRIIKYWRGCDEGVWTQKYQLIHALVYVLDSLTPSDFITTSNEELLYQRLKCLIKYDPDKVIFDDKAPWLTADSTDWLTADGYYWALPSD